MTPRTCPGETRHWENAAVLFLGEAQSCLCLALGWHQAARQRHKSSRHCSQDLNQTCLTTVALSLPRRANFSALSFRAESEFPSIPRKGPCCFIGFSTARSAMPISFSCERSRLTVSSRPTSRPNCESFVISLRGELWCSRNVIRIRLIGSPVDVKVHSELG